MVLSWCIVECEGEDDLAFDELQHALTLDPNLTPLVVLRIFPKRDFAGNSRDGSGIDSTAFTALS